MKKLILLSSLCALIACDQNPADSKSYPLKSVMVNPEYNYDSQKSQYDGFIVDSLANVYMVDYASRVISFAFRLSISATDIACSGDYLYAVDGTSLYEIDPKTGNAAEMLQFNGVGLFESLNGLYVSSDRTIYATTSKRLFKVIGENVTEIGSISPSPAGDLVEGNDGRLLVTTSNGKLISVDKLYGATKELLISERVFFGLAYDKSGTKLYAIGVGDTLFQLNIADSSVTKEGYIDGIAARVYGQ